MGRYLSAALWAMMFALFTAASLVWCFFTMGALAGPLGLDGTCALLTLPKDVILKIGLGLSVAILGCFLPGIIKGRGPLEGEPAMLVYLFVMMRVVTVFATFACNCCLFLVFAWLLHFVLPELAAALISVVLVLASFLAIVFRKSQRAVARTGRAAAQAPPAPPPPPGPHLKPGRWHKRR